MPDEPDFQPLIQYLTKLPGIVLPIGSGESEEAWWVKFGERYRPCHPSVGLAWWCKSWMVFMPVSPPPYMNGGPKDFLSWVIECDDLGFTPADCAEWLEGRLPRPVDDMEQWKIEDD
jgi:hypothetical protein